MAFRKKFQRKKRYTRKKRGVKRRTFKRYTKKRMSRQKKFGRGKKSFGGLNKSLDGARFKIRLNRRQLALSDQKQIIHLGNPADLTYSGLSNNLSMLLNYNQWRIDRVVTYWRIKNTNRNRFRGDDCNHAIVCTVPNDDTGADGKFEDLMFNSDQTELQNFLLNYTQLRGLNYRKVSPWGGKRAFKPYITWLRTTYSKNSTAAPSSQTQLLRDYSKKMHYALSSVRYEAPLFMIVPGMVKQSNTYNGSFGISEIDMTELPTEFPQLEIWSDVYVTARQYDTLSLTAPNRVANPNAKLPDLEANIINTDFNKVKEDVKEGIMDQISNSHPVLGAVAAIAGLRKRPRDEFKM